ncbi:hypothetical protein [Achromobacter ruhlandii]|uniref:hypothetical protein n=1 Tax=Achromobacter ruhlandii TaxID=72557 RepID=UPI0012E7032F|nr:hypothetical protein [Achromobacter ruhlandii]
MLLTLSLIPHGIHGGESIISKEIFRGDRHVHRYNYDFSLFAVLGGYMVFFWEKGNKWEKAEISVLAKINFVEFGISIFVGILLRPGISQGRCGNSFASS